MIWVRVRLEGVGGLIELALGVWRRIRDDSRPDLETQRYPADYKGKGGEYSKAYSLCYAYATPGDAAPLYIIVQM